MPEKFLTAFSNDYITFGVYALIGWIYEVSWYLIVENRFVNRGVLFGPFLPIYGFGMLILLFILKDFIKKKHYTSNIFYTLIFTVTIVTFVYVSVIEYTNLKIYDVSYFLERYGLGLFITNFLAVILVNVFIKKKKMDTTIILVFLIIWIITTVIEYVSHFALETYFNKLLWDYSHDFLNINRRVNWDASRNFALGGTFLLYVVQPLIDKFLNKTKLNTKVLISLVIGIPMIVDFIF